VTWPEAEAAAPVDQTEITPAWNKRETVTDPETGELRIEIVDDFGEQELHPHGLVIGGAGRETYSIMPDDPLSAKMETHWTETRRRGDWSIRTETFGRLTATARHWIVWGKIEAYEGDELVFEKEFNEEIPRLLQ
jgi:hypothetical protein